MNEPRSQLYQRIASYSPGGDNSQMFLRRLARENRWSLSYAQRVIEEYRRFMFLAIVAGHPVTPSEEVDQAWHLHLMYTRSYWDEFCRQVLGKPIHHEPTRGGPSERERHHAQYERTLASYRQWFERQPPSDIWPTTETRFGPASRQVRVCPAHVWIVPKPWALLKDTVPTSFFVGVVLLPMFAGLLNPLDMTGRDFLGFYLIVCAIVIAAATIARMVLRHDNPMVEEARLTPYQTAYLAGGADGALRASVAALVASERLRIVESSPDSWFGRPQYRLVCDGPAAEGDPLEDALCNGALSANVYNPRQVIEAGRPAAEAIENSLAEQGLVETDESFLLARWVPLLMLAMVWLLGAAKMGVGVSRGKPVAFLVMILIALSVVGVCFWRRPLRTRPGDRVLGKIKSDHRALRELHLQDETGIGMPELVLAAGLFGVAALDHPGITQLKTAMSRAGADGSSSGFLGSGACGSGCGAGCGGGGGCGGAVAVAAVGDDGGSCPYGPLRGIAAAVAVQWAICPVGHRAPPRLNPSDLEFSKRQFMRHRLYDLATTLLMVGGLAAAGATHLVAADSQTPPTKVHRFARFQVGNTVAYGLVENEQVRQIDGDLFGEWKPGDKHLSLDPR